MKGVVTLSVRSEGGMQQYHRHDIEILKRHFDIEVVKWKKQVTFSIPETLELLKKGKDADFIISLFPYKHSVISSIFSKIMRIPHFLVFGVYPYERYSCAVRLSDMIILVDSKQKKELSIAYNTDKDKMIVVPREFDPDVFKSNIKKEDFVLTAGADFFRKGLDRVFSIAQKLPKIKFIIVGCNEKISYPIPENVDFTGIIPREELTKLYKRAKVYLQLSRWDALPNTLIEAMLCECIPIATKDDDIWGCSWDRPSEMSGFTINKKDFDNIPYLCSLVEKALNMDANKCKEARLECIKHFASPIRERKLVEIIENKVASGIKDFK